MHFGSNIFGLKITLLISGSSKIWWLRNNRFWTSLIWCCWLGNRKGNQLVKASASIPLQTAVNVSGRGIAGSTLQVERVWTCPVNMLNCWC